MHIGTDMNWHIRRLSKEHIKDIEKLYHSAEHVDQHPKDHFLQKFATGYTGIEYAGFIAYTPEDEPVACLCLVPCFIEYEGKRILAAQLTDAFTNINYRSNGLFSLLEDHIHSFARENGIQILFGFPNDSSFTLLIKKAWVQAGEMDLFWIPVHPVQRLFSLFTRSYKGIPRIDESGCDNSVLADGFAGIERSNEYLRYKSFTDTRVISAGESKAWVKRGFYCSIGDLELNTKDFDELISRVRRMAAGTAKRKLYFQCSRGPWLHKVFAEKYEARFSFPILFKILGEDIVPEKIKFTFADIDIF